MTETESMDKGKNIVIFSDGTGQEGGVGSNSNVYKLFKGVKQRTNEQIAFYDRGLGTGWRKLTGNMSGTGISKNILECYQFISDHYQAGDQLFLFGFSRGAATVRSLAGFISFFGILPLSRPELTKKAYAIYKISDEKRRKQEAALFIQRNGTTYCNIKFLGAWDTVAALGFPPRALKHLFHDLKLSPRVQHAYHALAIDEERKVFHPTPWQTLGEDGKSLLGKIPVDPKEGAPEDLEQKDRRQTVKQVWFCGVHADVGGGYPDITDKQGNKVAGHGVADIPLAWMIDNAVKHGLKLDRYEGVTIEQDHRDVIHDSRQSRVSKAIFRRKARSWDESKCGPLVVHASVVEREQGLVVGKGSKQPVSVKYVPEVESIRQKKYEVEPWTNKADEYWKYGLNIVQQYQREYDSQEG